MVFQHSSAVFRRCLLPAGTTAKIRNRTVITTRVVLAQPPLAPPRSPVSGLCAGQKPPASWRWLAWLLPTPSWPPMSPESQEPLLRSLTHLGRSHLQRPAEASSQPGERERPAAHLPRTPRSRNRETAAVSEARTRQSPARTGLGVVPGRAGQLRSGLATIKADVIASPLAAAKFAAPAAVVRASLVPGDRRAVAVSSQPAETQNVRRVPQAQGLRQAANQPPARTSSAWAPSGDLLRTTWI